MGIDDYQPSWMDDGGGLRGFEGEPDDDYDQGYSNLSGVTVEAALWDTTVTSQQNQSGDDPNSKGITVQTGPFSGGYLGVVNGVTKITLDERYFLIQDNGGGEVLISLNTTTCS